MLLKLEGYKQYNGIESVKELLGDRFIEFDGISIKYKLYNGCEVYFNLRNINKDLEHIITSSVHGLIIGRHLPNATIATQQDLEQALYGMKEGCEYCNDDYQNKYTRNDEYGKFEIENSGHVTYKSEDGERTTTKANNCYMCGRKLGLEG